MSTAKFDTLSTLDGSQSVPVNTVAQGSAKAWVNFNGTGTVAIRASFNVSSITDDGTGTYTVNFTTAMSDANYSISGSTQSYGSGRYLVVAEAHLSPVKTTSAIKINSAVSGAASQEGFPFDCPSVYVQVFR
jgi:hypothetical protein